MERSQLDDPSGMLSSFMPPEYSSLDSVYKSGIKIQIVEQKKPQKELDLLCY